MNIADGKGKSIRVDEIYTHLVGVLGLKFAVQNF